jgi:hypothetical protein
MLHIRKIYDTQVPVAHACNPSYSGGRDQEDPSSKSAWTKKFARPYLEKPFTKIGLGEGPEFKPQYCIKKKKKERKIYDRKTMQGGSCL